METEFVDALPTAKNDEEFCIIATFIHLETYIDFESSKLNSLKTERIFVRKKKIDDRFLDRPKIFQDLNSSSTLINRKQRSESRFKKIRSTS